MSDTREPERTAGGESRASGPLVATVIALLAVVVVVAIASGGGGESRGRVLDEEERALERARASESESARFLGAEPEVAVAVRRIADAGAMASIESGVPTASRAAGELSPSDLGDVGRAAVIPTAPTSGATPGSAAAASPTSAPREITLEQEYEHTAFFLDILVLRRDTLRRDLAEARRIGDGSRLRRLGPEEAVLDDEITRFNARSHELEARMREGAEETATAAAPEGL